MSNEPQVSLEQLDRINKDHRSELKKIRKMSEAQFQAFKKNFSVGCLDKITKIEAEEILTSMLTLNLKMKSDLTGNQDRF